MEISPVFVFVTYFGLLAKSVCYLSNLLLDRNLTPLISPRFSHLRNTNVRNIVLNSTLTLCFPPEITLHHHHVL